MLYVDEEALGAGYPCCKNVKSIRCFCTFYAVSSFVTDECAWLTEAGYCLQQMCRRYPGFMRVALQDPQPERRFFRRGWVTFAKNVNIKDICWNLNNIRVS